MWIHELPIGQIGDTDRFAFDSGTNTYSFPFASLVTAIIERTYNALTTTAKTLIGAINELKATVDVLNANSYTTVTGSYGMSAVRFYRRGNLVIVYVTGNPSGLTSGSKRIVAIPQAYAPRTATPYATGVTYGAKFQPFLINISDGYLNFNCTTEELTGLVNVQYSYFIDN